MCTLCVMSFEAFVENVVNCKYGKYVVEILFKKIQNKNKSAILITFFFSLISVQCGLYICNLVVKETGIQNPHI